MSEQKVELQRIKALRNYAAGLVGTRETIARAGLQDYADLVIAMTQNSLELPKPSETPQRSAHLERASAILQPLLRNAR